MKYRVIMDLDIFVIMSIYIILCWQKDNLINAKLVFKVTPPPPFKVTPVDGKALYTCFSSIFEEGLK